MKNKSEDCVSAKCGNNCKINNRHVRFTAIGGIQIDLKATPNPSAHGAKRDTRIDWSLGGSPFNVTKVAAAYGIPSAIIAPQSSAVVGWCREGLNALGVAPMLAERRDELPGTTVAFPNGGAGGFDLYVHRVAPLKIEEISGAATRALRSADLVVVGPIAVVDEATLELYRHIANNSRFRALFPHPHLVKHERFADVARLFDYVQINAAEARLLDANVDDHAMLGLRLRSLLNGTVEFAITNGPQEGLLWARDSNTFSWHTIRPAHVKAVSDIGAGDVWGSAYLIHHRLFGESAQSACISAALVAGRAISGVPLVSTSVKATSLPQHFANRSWVEFAV